MKECVHNRTHIANEINRVVKWQNNSDVGQLAGQSIRLRFVYRDAGLYVFQFRDGSSSKVKAKP